MKFYKILNEQENHKGLQYRTGRVDDPNPLDKDGSCVPGGIYFAPVTSILAFVDYGPWIREVTIPDNVEMIQDPTKGFEKYRASSVILGERERWEDVLQRLIDEGADTFSVNYALCWSANHGHINTIKLLLDNGADINVPEEGVPISLAAGNGHTEAARLLLERGADIHVGKDEALRWAAKNGHVDVVKLFLGSGADIHALDDHALRWAAGYGHTETVRVLLDHGANVHAQKDLALRWAAENGHTETVRVLLDAGANVHARDDEALHKAAERGHTETAELLKSYMENDAP